MDPMGYPTVLAHAILFDSSFVSQTFRLPKAAGPTYRGHFPCPELTPDPRRCIRFRSFRCCEVPTSKKCPKDLKCTVRLATLPGRGRKSNQKYISYTKPMEKGPETLREFTGLLFLTFTETWGDFSIRLVTSCYHFIGMACIWNSLQVQ